MNKRYLMPFLITLAFQLSSMTDPNCLPEACSNSNSKTNVIQVEPKEDSATMEWLLDKRIKFIRELWILNSIEKVDQLEKNYEEIARSPIPSFLKDPQQKAIIYEIKRIISETRQQVAPLPKTTTSNTVIIFDNKKHYRLYQVLTQ